MDAIQTEDQVLWVQPENSMTSIKRKLQRKKTKDAEKKMQEQLTMFDKIGDECLVCEAPFDKSNKEQVRSWVVAVRKKENKVNLYCPDCWNQAHEIIKDFKKYKEETNV